MTTITTPGKFEGEHVYVPHYWEQSLDGGPDATTYDEDDTEYSVFYIDDDDRARFPQLTGVYALVLYEDDQGFVWCKEFYLPSTLHTVFPELKG